MDAIKLIEEAIEAEEAAEERYKTGAKIADDPETRSMFEQLAEWEDGHKSMLKERLATLKMMKG
jgi:rubrerythrin